LVGNSSLQRNTQYTYTGSTITITDTLTAGAVIEVNYTSNEVPPLIVADTTAPTVPTNLASPSKTETTVNLTWTASTDAVGVVSYNIFKGGVLEKNVPSNSGQVTGLTAETPYSFTVSALDAAGNQSAQSTVLSVTTNAAPVAETLLLDNYPNAKVAYSFKKLRTAYAGACIRVRKGIDATLVEQDINFLNGTLDTAALLNFAGSATVYMHTIYDQSGNASNFVNTNTFQQPLIVESGNLILSGGNVIMKSTGGGTNLKTPFVTTAPLSTDFTVITDTNGWSSIGISQGGESVYGYFQNGGTAAINTNVGTPSLYVNNALFSGNRGALYTAITPTLKIIATTNLDMNLFTELHLDHTVANQIYPPSVFAAKIIYDSDQSANRVAIQDALNALYTVY